MTEVPAAEREWYENFYELRVLPRVNKDLGDCDGFFHWLGENAPELYAGITAADDLVNSVWQARGEQEAFKAACRDWLKLLVHAKEKFDAWQRQHQQDLVLAGRQEGIPF